MNFFPFLIAFVFLFQFSLLTGQKIEGYVYIDLNKSQEYDSGDKLWTEPVIIQLYSGCTDGTLISSTTTNNAGYYSFDVAEGEYSVQIDLANNPYSIVNNLIDNQCCIEISGTSQNGICNYGMLIPHCIEEEYSLCSLAMNSPILDLREISDVPCRQLPGQNGSWSGLSHCNGTYENTAFIGFVAGSGNYSFNIQVFACAGLGVQYGIMDACNPGGSQVVCEGVAMDGTISIDGNLLEPCKTYVLWLNGYKGSVCSFFASTTGFFQKCDPIVPVDLSLKLACDTSCNQNFAKAVQTISPKDLSNIHAFDWSVSNPDTSFTASTTIPKLDVTNLRPGAYNICIMIQSIPNHQPVNYCKSITIQPDYSVVLNTFTLCEKELPWFGAKDGNGANLLDEFGNHWRWSEGPVIWTDLTPDADNIFINNRTDSCGCAYQQEIKIIYYVPGKPCDDLDDETTDDIVHDDCVCRGESSSGFTDNTTWYYRPYTPTTTDDIWKVKALRDTIINEELYKIVGIDRGSGIIRQTEIPLALKGGKMYFFEQGQKKLLYDFNARVGDVVTYYVPQLQRLYDISSNRGFTEVKEKSYKILIERIDTLITTEGKRVKVFSTTNTERNEEFHFMNQIVENIGSISGLFGAFGPFSDSGTEGSIRCFEDIDGYYSIFNEDCNLVSVSTTNVSPYTLYPNPAQNEVNILGGHLSNAIIDCYDINGIKVAVNQYMNGERVILDVDGLTSGMYYVLIQEGNKSYPLRFVRM